MKAILNVILPDIGSKELDAALKQNLPQNSFQWIKISPKLSEEQHPPDQFYAPPDIKFDEPQTTKIVNLSSLMFDSLIGRKDEPNYYMHIANNGYTYESCLAFMPMYPLTIRSIADCIKSLYEAHDGFVAENVITFPTLLLICTQLVNVITFIMASDRYGTVNGEMFTFWRDFDLAIRNACVLLLVSVLIETLI